MMATIELCLKADPYPSDVVTSDNNGHHDGVSSNLSRRAVYKVR